MGLTTEDPAGQALDFSEQVRKCLEQLLVFETHLLQLRRLALVRACKVLQGLKIIFRSQELFPSIPNAFEMRSTLCAMRP